MGGAGAVGPRAGRAPEGPAGGDRALVATRPRTLDPARVRRSRRALARRARRAAAVRGRPAARLHRCRQPKARATRRERVSSWRMGTRAVAGTPGVRGAATRLAGSLQAGAGARLAAAEAEAAALRRACEELEQQLRWQRAAAAGASSQPARLCLACPRCLLPRTV